MSSIVTTVSRRCAPRERRGRPIGLAEGVAALSEEYRVAVILRDIGDLDYNEIAEVLGVAIGTVVEIARGRSILARGSGTATTTRNVQAQDEMADMTDDDFTLDELAARTSTTR